MAPKTSEIGQRQVRADEEPVLGWRPVTENFVNDAGIHMKPEDLVFIGIKGSVVALHSATGQQAWAAHLKGSDAVNVVIGPESILASCQGEIFCLDPRTGNTLWHNQLKGFGIWPATIAIAH